ncbi:MAG: DUF1585 domain-containing protein [Chthoniobacteraceae bacterium]
MPPPRNRQQPTRRIPMITTPKAAGRRSATALIAAGELPDGRSFSGIREFKKLVREEDELLARNLVGQFLIFATGAPLHFNNRPAIDGILRRAKSARYGLRTLIHEIVESDLFREK